MIDLMKCATENPQVPNISRNLVQRLMFSNVDIFCAESSAYSYSYKYSYNYKHKHKYRIDHLKKWSAITVGLLRYLYGVPVEIRIQALRTPYS
jgi:hypothetical protein